MKRLTAFALGCLAACWIPQAPAQFGEAPEEIYTRASKEKVAYKGYVVQESPRGVQLMTESKVSPFGRFTSGPQGARGKSALAEVIFMVWLPSACSKK